MVMQCVEIIQYGKPPLAHLVNKDRILQMNLKLDNSLVLHRLYSLNCRAVTREPAEDGETCPPSAVKQFKPAVIECPFVGQFPPKALYNRLPTSTHSD